MLQPFSAEEKRPDITYFCNLLSTFDWAEEGMIQLGTFCSKKLGKVNRYVCTYTRMYVCMQACNRYVCMYVTDMYVIDMLRLS